MWGLTHDIVLMLPSGDWPMPWYCAAIWGLKYNIVLPPGDWNIILCCHSLNWKGIAEVRMGGGEGYAKSEQMWTRGGEKMVFLCGCPLWMAPYYRTKFLQTSSASASIFSCNFWTDRFSLLMVSWSSETEPRPTSCNALCWTRRIIIWRECFICLWLKIKTWSECFLYRLDLIPIYN